MGGANEVKYRGLLTQLTREILGGKFVPLGTFPSERALSMRFGVSRQTIRRVVSELNRRGLIYSRQGRGTFLTRSGKNLRETVGLILTGERRTEIGREIREEVTRLAERMGLSLVFGDASALNARDCVRSAVRLAREFVDAKVSGVILQPIEFLPDAERQNERVVSTFSDAKIPVVLIDCDIVSEPGRSACDVVGIDNFQAGRLLAEHLVANGARKIAFLAQCDYPATIAARIAGVESAVGAGGSFSVLSLPGMGARTISRGFRRQAKPDAVVCQNDIAAVNALVAFKALRWRVPQDVLVAGFDDVAYAPLVQPSLTSVRQPCRQIAGRAFDLLLSRIGNPGKPVEEVRIGAHLVARRSTRCA